MRAKTGLALILGITCFATVADARDDRLRLPLAAVLSSPDAQRTLDVNVHLYFGKQPYAEPVRRLGQTTSNKKTNFLNKTDQEGCNWAFLSSVKGLQDAARKAGANAVVNIVSSLKNQDFVSETEFECSAGTFVGGVVLKGELVSLK